MDGDSVLTVAEITRRIKSLLASSFGALWIEGEISGFKRHTSGHAYFTLKDASAQLSCAMWRSSMLRMAFEPRDGLKVQAFGNLEVYEPSGRYQLIVSLLRPSGEGELQRKLELLKAKLQAEGLFDLARKRLLPKYPGRIGIVTSPTGAVIHDIQTVASRRWPGCELILRPVRVQGEGAAREIAAAIEAFNRDANADVLIVGRGGGSLEDLWAFNEEVVARAIYASIIPVVSAVGHEVDFTIADMVADVRAATPSAAAEIVVPDAAQAAADIEAIRARLRRALFEQHRHLRSRVDSLSQHWAFRQPLNIVLLAAQRVGELDSRLKQIVERRVRESRSDLSQTVSLLQSYRPQSVLERGYSIVRDEEGRIVRESRVLQFEQKLSIELAKGVVDTKVTQIR